MAKNDDNSTSSAPAPEVLHEQSDSSSKPAEGESQQRAKFRLRRATYRPSHKATFIALGVVVAILAVNAGIIAFALRGGAENSGSAVNHETVTLSSDTLNKLGVSHDSVGAAGAKLTIGPETTFNGGVTIAGDASIGGQLSLNGTFTASDASFGSLQAGETQLQQLNVNGDATVSNLALRSNLSVAGQTTLQGPVTANQLMTVNNNLNVAGNLSVGGQLSARAFQASSLISDTTLMIGGHIITRGSAPGISRGPALGSNGTVSISGNDAAGTIGVNFGVGGGNGILATVSFTQNYQTTPHVVVTGIGAGMGSLYISRSSSGFSVGVQGAVSPGGYAIDYIVMQ
jgi:hypothetical protein